MCANVKAGRRRSARQEGAASDRGGHLRKREAMLDEAPPKHSSFAAILFEPGLAFGYLSLSPDDRNGY